MLNSNIPSLENICLDLIVQEFERFYFAFTLSKNKKLLWNAVFLQKRFSDILIKKIFSIEMLKNVQFYQIDFQTLDILFEKQSLRNTTLINAYFDFLINEHLSFLDCNWFKNSHHLKSMENIFCRLPNLTKISFSSHGDEILKNITIFCPKIVEISAVFSDLTDNGIKYLYELKNGIVPCPELKKIDIIQSFVTDEGAECLIKNLPSIEKFRYPFLPLVLHSIRVNRTYRMQEIQFYNLVELNIVEADLLICLDKSYYNKILESCLFLCPKLESIFCRITDKEQFSLFANKHWRELKLIFVTQNINIDNFIKVNGFNLSNLNISNCTVSTSALSVYCPVLKELSIDNVNIIDDDNFKIFFPCLTKIHLSGNDSETVGAFCSILLSSPRLECIRLSCRILDLEIENQILMSCKSCLVKEINFLRLNLKSIFLEDILLNGPFLETLVLSSCKFDNPNTKEILQNLAKRLPNKPYISFLTDVFD